MPTSVNSLRPTQHKLIRRILGASRLYRPIEGVFFNTEGYGQKIHTLFLGAFHGDEPESAHLLLRLITWLTSRPEATLGKPIAIVPWVNPDGYANQTRQNALGVDLNRNFPTHTWESNSPSDRYYAGPYPASEPETRLVMDLIAEADPEVIVTVHTPYRVVNYDGPAKVIAERMSALCGYPVEESIGYPTPGSFGTYCGIERQIPTITLELPDNIDEDHLWEDNRASLLSVLDAC